MLWLRGGLSVNRRHVMNRKFHLRTSFAAKLAAVILLLACLTGTVAGVVV